MVQWKFKHRLQLFKAITVIVALGASLGMAELGIRLCDGCFSRQVELSTRDRGLYEFSATRHHRLVPNTVLRHSELEYSYVWANNSLGMRDRERSARKDPDAFRLLFLGDSMVQGYGVPVEKSMVALLEDSLNRPARAKEIEVLNAGVFGYSPFLYYLYLKELMPVVDPDAVIVGFFLGNDVGDDYFYTTQARVNEEDGSVYFEETKWPWAHLDKLVKEKINVPDHERHVEVASGVARHYASHVWATMKPVLLKSQLVRTIKNVRDQARDRSTKRDAYRKRMKLRADIVQERLDDIRINLGLVNYPVKDRAQRLKYWELSKGYLAAIRRLCEERRIPMVMVVIPVLEPEVAEFAEPYEILDEIGQELSVPVIQLVDEFRNHPIDKLTYEVDGHWNAEGNRLAAAIIDRELRRLDILP